MITLILILATSMILVGTIFCFASSLGMLRMPDIYCRVHAGGMGQTLGPIALLLAYWAVDGSSGPGAIVLLATFFLLISTAVGSHIIDRAAYRSHLPITPQTVGDEWEGREQSSQSERRRRTFER